MGELRVDETSLDRGFELELLEQVGRLLVPADPDGASDEDFAVPATHRRVWDFSRDGVRRSLADSLERMGLDRADVLLLHDAEEHFDAALRTGFPALAELRAEGVVGAIGAGMADTAMLTTLVREADVDVVMQAGRCTLLDHSAFDELVPACASPPDGLLDERRLHLEIAPGHDVVEHAHAAKQCDVLERARDAGRRDRV